MSILELLIGMNTAGRHMSEEQKLHAGLDNFLERNCMSLAVVKTREVARWNSRKYFEALEKHHD